MKIVSSVTLLVAATVTAAPILAASRPAATDVADLPKKISFSRDVAPVLH